MLLFSCQLEKQSKTWIHLIFQLNTDDAISLEIDREILQFKEDLDIKSIKYNKITKTKEKIGGFILWGFDPKDKMQIRKYLDENINKWEYSWEDNQASIFLRASVIQHIKEQSIIQTTATIKDRLDALKVRKSVINRDEIIADRIIIEIPGIYQDDLDRIERIIEIRAFLEFKLVNSGPAPDMETLLKDYGGEVPEDMQVVRRDPRRTEEGYYLVDSIAPVTGKDLRDARRTYDEWNNPAVAFVLNSEGGRRFHKFTSENIGKPLSIILDGKVQEVAIIEESIRERGIIHGRFTKQEADDISLVLRQGSLPVSVELLEEKIVTIS
jgi:preprotein translocase subunit SecD